MKLRFSIRDLLWLTLVVGMAVSWWIDHRQLDNKCTAYEEAEQYRRSMQSSIQSDAVKGIILKTP